MRRVDTQIARARAIAHSKDPSASSGIPVNNTLEFINDAQDIIQSLISAAYAKFNIKEDIQSTVAGTEGYTPQDRRVYLNNRFVSVEISESGQLDTYQPLRKGDFYERDTDRGYPQTYIRRGSEILLNPIPDSAAYKIRTNFEAEANDLDIRRGRIASITGDGTSGTPLTAIVLETSAPTPDEIDTVLTDLLPGDYICVVDKDGIRQSQNIPVTGYTSGTRTIAVDSFVMADNDTLPAAGDYITVGKYTTTHSELPDGVDNYLVMYTAFRILSNKGSTNISRAYEKEVMDKEKEIIGAYAKLGQELLLIPEIGDKYL